MKKLFKITPAQHIALLSNCIIRYSIILLIFYFANLNLSSILWVISVLFVIDVLPVLILHLQYYLINRNASLSIDTDEKSFAYSCDLEARKYDFKEITKVSYVTSYAFSGAPGWYAFGEYRYFRFTFSDNSVIIITSLMVPNIQQNLEGILLLKAERDQRILAFITKKDRD